MVGGGVGDSIVADSKWIDRAVDFDFNFVIAVVGSDGTSVVIWRAVWASVFV